MNSNPPLVSLLRIRIAVLLALGIGSVFVDDARAQTSADWIGTTSGNLSVTTNWSPNSTPNATFTGNFNNATYTNAPNATAATTEMGKIYVGSSSGALTFGTSTNNITLSGVSGVGIEVVSGAGAVNTSTTSFRLAGSQTWSNNSSNTLTIGGTITNNSSSSPVTLTINGTGNTILSGIISDNTVSGQTSLTKAGAGTLTLTGNNTYTGATTINAGGLQIGNNGNTGSISSSSVITITSGTLFVHRTGSPTIANTIFLGNGTQRIENRNTASSATFSGDISSLAGAASTLSLAANTNQGLTFTGNITVNGGVAFGSSYPSITLSGNNSASSWNIQAGAVTLSSAGALGSSGSITMSGGGLIFTNNSTDVSSRIVVGSGSSYRLGVVSSNTFTINSALTANGTNALIVGANAAGTLVLGNSNSSFTGAVSITAGTLSVAGIGNTGSNSYLGTNSSITIASQSTTGTLLYTGSGETTNKTITIAGAQGATITANNPTGSLRFTSNVISAFTASKSLTLSGTGMGEIAGSIGNNGANVTSLVKSGAGTWTLSGNNSYTGNTTVNDGILVFQNKATRTGGSAVSAAAAGTIGLGVGGGGVTDYSDTDVAALFNSTLSGFTLNSASGVALDTTAGDFTQSSALTAARALTKLGNNTLTLGNATNSYNGTTTIAAGTLSVGSIGNSTANSAVGRGSTINIGLNDSTGTLLYTGLAQTTNRTINLSGTTGGAVIDQSGTGLLRFTTNLAATGNGNKTLTLQGSTSGTGELSGAISDFAANTATTALVKAGTGTWTLSGTNTYTGGTTLSAGVLGINATAALGSSGNITFSGGTMQFASGGSAADYGARIKNSASAIIIDTNNQSVTFSGAMDSSNTLGLTKNGAGNLTLSSANTYSGGTTINAGTLALSGASGSVAGTIAVDTGAALQLAQATDTSLANNISGAGNIVHTASSATTLAGTNTNTGSIQSTGGGTLLFSGEGALSSNITGLSASGGSTLGFADGTTRTITLGNSGISLSTAKLSFDVDLSSSASDRLDFGGAATLSGTNVVNLGFLNSISSGGNWTLLTAASGLNGTWSLGTYTPQTGYSFSLTSNATSLWLSAAASSALAYWTGEGGSSWGDTNFSTTINGTASIAGGSLTSASDVIFAGNNAGNLTTTLGSDYTINTLTINTPEVAINGSNTLNVTSSSSSAINISATGNTTINAGLAGAAGLTKSGSGTLTLNGSNTYAGGTSITGGTVVVGSSTSFGNSSGAVTLNPGAGNTTTLRSGASGLTLANNMALSSGTTAFDTNSNNTTLSGVLSSTGALTKSGAGILTLTANNTHTGGITISAGGIALSGSGALADSEAVNLSATGTSFDISAISASGETIASIAGASGSTIALGAKTLTVGGDNTSTTFSGSMGGTGGALVKTGSGTLTLDGGNTYTGATTISAGGIQIGNGGTTGSLSTSGTFTNNGVLTFNRSNNVAQGTDFTSTAIGGSGSLVQSGTGNLTLSSANTYSGGTTLNSGTLVLNNSTAIGAGALTINGGTLNNTSGASITLTSNNTQNWNANFAFTGTNDLNLGTGAVALGNSASRTITLNGGNLTVGGIISGASSSLTKAGAGTLTLTGNNTYNGGTTISAGTLELAGTAGNLAGSITNNGTLLCSGSNVITLSNAISGSGGITLNGTGRVDLGSSSNSFTGGIVINSGTLRTTGSNVLPNSSSVTISGGVLDLYDRASAISLLTLANGDVTFHPSYSATLTASSGYILQNGSVSAILAGSGALTKNGSGTVTLSGNNTISGTTTVSNGSLVLSGNGTLGTSTISITGGTLDLGGKSLTNTFSITNGTLVNGTITNNNANYAFQGGNVNANLAGTNTSLTKTGSDTLTLNGTNSYTGATTISAGNLSINATTALGSTSGVNLANNTALIYTGSSAATLDRAISVTGGTGTIRNTGGALTLTGGLTKNGTTLILDSGTFNVNTIGISGSANNSDLVIDGATVNLNVANTYNGPTSIIDGGTLNANVANALPTTNGRTAITMDATGSGNSTLALGANQSVASLAGAASSTVNLGSSTLTINSTSGSTTYAGGITGTGNLVKEGASTQVLSGATTFNGTTTVNSGTLTAAAANALGGTTQIDLNGGSLLVTAAAINDNAGIKLGGGTLAVSGNFSETVGALTLSANSTIDFSGFTGTLRFGSIANWTDGAKLSVWNWAGTPRYGDPVNPGRTSNLVFTDNTNLTSNLANISFYSGSGSGFIGNAFEDGFTNGTLIIAVPEPETYITGVLLLLGFTISQIRLAREGRGLLSRLTFLRQKKS